MFNNLIESQSHGKEFKRRGRFLLATTAVYVLAFFIVGIASIYAYDAQLEAQNGDLELISMVPPVNAEPPVQPRPIQQPRRSPASNAPTDRFITLPQRTSGITTTDNPNLVPKNVGIEASPVPPVTDNFRIGPTNLNPPGSGSQEGCPTCSGNSSGNTMPVTELPPPVRVVPTTRMLTSTILRSKAISLPQPQYPAMAKQARVQGPVVIQILVDETGKVMSAQVVSGNPMLTANARGAAMRARFTPTMLNDQPVKVQGVITYNFVLQ